VRFGSWFSGLAAAAGGGLVDDDDDDDDDDASQSCPQGGTTCQTLPKCHH